MTNSDESGQPPAELPKPEGDHKPSPDEAPAGPTPANGETKDTFWEKRSVSVAVWSLIINSAILLMALFLPFYDKWLSSKDDQERIKNEQEHAIVAGVHALDYTILLSKPGQLINISTCTENRATKHYQIQHGMSIADELKKIDSPLNDLTIPDGLTTNLKEDIYKIGEDIESATYIYQFKRDNVDSKGKVDTRTQNSYCLSSIDKIRQDVIALSSEMNVVEKARIKKYRTPYIAIYYGEPLSILNMPWYNGKKESIFFIVNYYSVLLGGPLLK